MKKNQNKTKLRPTEMVAPAIVESLIKNKPVNLLSVASKSSRRVRRSDMQVANELRDAFSSNGAVIKGNTIRPSETNLFAVLNGNFSRQDGGPNDCMQLMRGYGFSDIVEFRHFVRRRLSGSSSNTTPLVAAIDEMIRDFEFYGKEELFAAI